MFSIWSYRSLLILFLIVRNAKIGRLVRRQAGRQAGKLACCRGESRAAAAADMNATAEAIDRSQSF